MSPNMGSADRWIRGVAGVAVIAWGFWAGSLWGAIGVILLATAFVGVCPAYLPFGIRTRSRRD